MTGFESLPQCAPRGTKDVLELLVNVNVNVQSTITNLVSIEISPVKLRGSCGARAASPHTTALSWTHVPPGTELEENYSHLDPARARALRALRKFVMARTVSIVQSTEMVGV